MIGATDKQLECFHNIQYILSKLDLESLRGNAEESDEREIQRLVSMTEFYARSLRNYLDDCIRESKSIQPM